MQVKLHAKSAVHTFDCAEGEQILYAGLRHGLRLPYECATGTCGTCRGRVRDLSTIDDRWPAAPGGKRLKREKGDFLMCQAFARGDCEIAVPSEIAAPDSDSRRPNWTGGRITTPRLLTHDVLAFSIALADPIVFEAGQFVVLERAGLAGLRAYSMVNDDGSTRRLDLVVKKKPGGGFCERLFADGSEGAELRVFGPLGAAVFKPSEPRDLLCIAGGSGIAGMMAILERALRVGHFRANRADVYFGVRGARDIFYHRELADFVARAAGQLGVTIALSDEAPSADPPGDGALQYAQGFVHQVAAAAMAGRYANVVAFVAGPPPMVDGALKVLVTEARLPPNYIRYDKFS